MWMAKWAEMEYTAWLEDTVREMVDIDPACIALELIDKAGIVHTCYWRVSADDRAQMISGMQDDDRLEWLKANRDVVLEILSEEDEEEEEEEDGEDEWTTGS
jgi:hypothetical protein